jgi:hypothetical protein
MIKIILAPGISCTAPAGRHLEKSPSFPLCQRGMKAGFCFCSLRLIFSFVAALPQLGFPISVQKRIRRGGPEYAEERILYKQTSELCERRASVVNPLSERG